MQGSIMRWLTAALMAVVVAAPAAQAQGGPKPSDPQPGTPEYGERDTRNIADAYGRQTGQQLSPAYVKALREEHGEVTLNQLTQQMATPNRLAITPGNVFPGWNGGNPLRRGWSGRRGLRVPVSYTNRYGALIRGNVFAPLPGAKDPYTGAALKPPYPGVVITTGSVQGSERMYFWLAQDLTERGYVVLTYDVQGQGTSETLPHDGSPVNALPFCNPFAEPQEIEQYGCPGVPAQQPSNFIYGTLDALDFFLSTPDQPYENRAADDVPVNAFNPLWKQFDRSADKRTVTPGRTTRVAIIGHSLGASAVSYVQGVDSRVETAVALDKLGLGYGGVPEFKPVVPALGVQSEYGFGVQPYWLQHGSSIAPAPGDPSQPPDPRRELATGFDGWKKAGVDSMVIVPRASTHLEYTDIAYALPASRYGQALASVYTQLWLDRYLKHKGEPKAKKARTRGGKRRRARARRAAIPQPDELLARSFTYLEPVDVGKWEPSKLAREDLLSFYFCSGWSFHDRRSGKLLQAGC